MIMNERDIERNIADTHSTSMDGAHTKSRPAQRETLRLVWLSKLHGQLQRSHFMDQLNDFASLHWGISQRRTRRRSVAWTQSCKFIVLFKFSFRGSFLPFITFRLNFHIKRTVIKKKPKNTPYSHFIDFSSSNRS